MASPVELSKDSITIEFHPCADKSTELITILSQAIEKYIFDASCEVEVQTMEPVIAWINSRYNYK